ncbi:hypothetical protein [Streptomyces sp. NBC_01257]|uniref:hypothetical protein n=1 Tax=Streptomyces sp. NBC_01257 TaxID=2903799 RepID=UPI002DDBBECA|nr:hypothetical protein [Streptomyces sp. NBC_01257]WRZ69262.1 hypothetical protein OG408_37570 [Streptomyces sp. NBC_01257]
METEYEIRLRETVDQVEACNSIQIEEYDRGPIAVYMEQAEDAFKIIRLVQDAALPNELTRNFHRFSRLLFSWRAASPFDKIAGEFHIVHIAEAIVRGPQSSSFDPDSELGQLIGEFRVFETHPTGGTGTYSALRLTHNQDSPEIWYFDIRQGPTRLDISYSEYLDVMLHTKGLYNWQYLFATPDKENYGMRASLPNLHDGLEFLTRKFPDTDLTDLRDRWRERMRLVNEEA